MKYILLGLTLFLSGCQTVKYVPVQTKIEISKELLVPCEPLNKLTGLTAEDSLHWKIDAALKHKACSTKDQALIDAVKVYMEK